MNWVIWSKPKVYRFRKFSGGGLHENFWQEKVLHMVETKEHPSHLGLAIAVLRQLFNGQGLTQIGELLALSKASVIGVRKNKLPSSLMVGWVGCHILYWMRFEFISISIQFCVDLSFGCIIKQLVYSLEQNIGCWRQAFNQPTAGLHQVWGRTEKLHLIWALRGPVSMLSTCEKLYGGVELA